MSERVALKLQEVAPSRSYAPNPLDLRSGRSESSASQPRASRVIPPNPTRPARSHYCSLGSARDEQSRASTRLGPELRNLSSVRLGPEPSEQSRAGSAHFAKPARNDMARKFLAARRLTRQ